MTKRISQANTVVVPVVETHGVAAQAGAVKAAAAVANAENAAEKADVTVEKAEAAPAAEEAVVAVVATAPIAMVAAPADQDAAASAPASTTDASTDEGGDTNYTPYIVGGVLLAGGIAAIALSGDDNNSAPAPTPTPTPTPTNTVTFSSAATATTAENVAGGSTGVVVLDVNAAAAATGGAPTYALSGTDAASFTINATTGEIRFVTSPNFEAKSSYAVTVTASSAANGTTPAATATQAVTISVTNVNEAPTFANAAVTATVAENTAITTALAGTGTATDPDAGTTLTYSLTGTDAAAFTVNAAGAVFFRASPDFETKSSYSFNLVASDAATGGLSATQAVTVAVTNVNEAPTFPAGTAAVTIAENTATTTALTGTGVATDLDAGTTLTYSLTGTDAAAFTVNSAGQVFFRTSPDFETKSSYSFNLVASDGSLSATRPVTVTVTDVVNEGPPPATASLDQGAATAVTINAGTNAFTFNETASGQSNVIINNFSADDRIVVTGVNGSTPSTTYSFSSIDNDLVISFNSGGTVSQIQINDVVSPNAFIFSEASAEAAVGAQLGVAGGTLDFFRYG